MGFFTNIEEKVKGFFTNLEPSPELKKFAQGAKTYAEQNQQGLQVFKNIASKYTEFTTPRKEDIFATALKEQEKGGLQESSFKKAQSIEYAKIGAYKMPGTDTYVDPFGVVGSMDDISRTVIRNIAKEVEPTVIGKFLKKFNIADDVIPNLSKRLSKISDETEVEKIVSNEMKLAPKMFSKSITPAEAKVRQAGRSIAKETREEEIYRLETEISNAEESLAKDKSSNLMKYASNKGQTRALPEMTGQKGQGLFRQTGDQVVESAGFKDIQEAENAFEGYVRSKELLKEKKIELKSVKEQFKSEKLAGEAEKVEEFSALKDEEEFLKSMRAEVLKDLKEATSEQNKLLYDIKTGVLKAVEKEKNELKQQIVSEKSIKDLSNNVLLRLREKEGIESWANANKEQLQSILDDLGTFQKGDVVLPLTQVESMKQFGIKSTTTSREASEVLGDVVKWKDRTKPLFNFFKTIDQKINNAAGQDAEKVKNVLTRPRAEAVTNMFKEEIALKTEMRDMLDKGRVNNKKDRGLIMKYGEGRMSLEELKKSTPRWQAVIEADNWFRKQYDRLLDEANKEMSRFYPDKELIPRRKDYYTHSQEIQKWWEMLKYNGGEISPILEYVSEFTKPNRKFNPFALKRKGGLEFVEDAGKAFEAYLSPILHNKYMSESIVRHRAVANIVAHKTLDTKNVNLFVNSLEGAADNLAGKTNPFDRALMDKVLSRKVIQSAIAVSNKMGKNRIIGNVGSAMMQISGVPSSVIENNMIRTSKGLLTQALSPFLGANDPLSKSSFLLRRYGEKGLQHGETIFKTATEKGGNILSIPFIAIEKNVTKAIWRASFDNAYSQGFRGTELITKADEITGKIVGARSIGEKAMAFESGLLSLPLQFQLEVNTHAQLWMENVFGKMFKNPMKAARAATETAIALFLMNTLFERTFGRTPLPDPIRAIGDATESDTWVEGVGRIAGEGLSSIPGGQFIANAYPLSESDKKKYFGRSEVGIYPGGIPIQSSLQGAFKNPTNFVYDFVLPYGGGQLKKILEGVEALDKMGSYDKDGRLQFPINQNQWLQVVLFGRYSTKEAKEYFDKQRKQLSEKQTIEYFLRTQKGENPQDTYNDITKDRRKGEFERELESEVIKKIKNKPEEGLALLLLWKKQGIISESMEKNILNELKK